MKRNYTIDTLRTIATLLVILVHVSSEYVLAGKDKLAFDASFWTGNIVDSFSRICIPLFVLISGMFLVGRNESFKQSYQKRASRILIPLVSWTIIYLLFRAFLDFRGGNSIHIKSLVVSAVWGRPYYHMWYLYMVVGLYFITPVINNSIFLISRKALWILAISLLIFGMLNMTYNKIEGNEVWFILWSVDYLGYFILGYLIKEYPRKFAIIGLLSLYIMSSLLTAILSYYTITYFDNLYFYGYLTPFVIIGSLSVYKIFQQLDFKENILSKISHLTLGIYLIHAGVLYIVVRGLIKLDIPIFDNPIIGILVKFCLTLFISIIVVKIISRIKYLNRII